MPSEEALIRIAIGFVIVVAVALSGIRIYMEQIAPTIQRSSILQLRKRLRLFETRMLERIAASEQRIIAKIDDVVANVVAKTVARIVAEEVVKAINSKDEKRDEQ